jgi:hypothetical protein
VSKNLRPNRWEVDPQPEPEQATWAKVSITVECLPLEVKNEGGSRLGNHLETSGGLKVVIK